MHVHADQVAAADQPTEFQVADLARRHLLLFGDGFGSGRDRAF